MPFRLRWRPWMLGAAVWIAPAIFATASTIAQHRLRNEPLPNVADLLFAGLDWLIYGILAPVIFAVCNRWPVVRPIVRQRVLLHVGFAFLTAVAWAVGGKVLQLGLNYLFRRDQLREFLATLGDDVVRNAAMDIIGWIFITLPFGMIVYTCVAVLAHAVRYLSDAKEREVQLARVSEQLAGARVAALESQLNPHFLFNALNTIAVRARDGDGPGTVSMVEQLSDLLRRTLSRHRSSEVTLEEELDLIRQYVAIEQARFPDRLTVTIQVDRDLHSAAVPGFSLQHLVENAIRHGIARRPGAGTVQISARRDGETLVLVVVDDGAGLTAAELPVGHGIENTRERLRVLYGETAALTIEPNATGGTTATLRVPFHEIALEAGVAQR
ncbi:MAG TPA: histidine kinase [Gemmatimonadaceae bacterium]|nr:histidine kinase [Gemmatimonadaceae bacterium]